MLSINFINTLMENIWAFYYYYPYTTFTTPVYNWCNSITSWAGDEEMRQKQKCKVKNRYKSSEKRKKKLSSKKKENFRFQILIQN